MRNRLIALFLALAVLFSFPLQIFVSFASHNDIYPLSDFHVEVASFTPDTIYNYDYWLLIAQRNQVSESSSYDYKIYLYLIPDQSPDTYGSPKGRLYFDTGSTPSLNRLYFTHNVNGIGTDYDETRYYYLRSMLSSAESLAIPSGSARVPTADSSYILGNMTFDNLHYDEFPVCYGSSSTYCTYTILASNVDIYNYQGQLLQYGNYYTLLEYIQNSDPSRITDYSGHEISAGVTVPDPTEPPPTKPVEEQQVEISNNILDNIKNMLSTIVNLPSKIADAIGGFFTSLGETIGGFFSDLAEKIKGFFIDLGNTILDGLKFLFVPSDNLFLDLIDLIHEKFGFIFQILEIGDFIINYDFKESPPDATVKFNNSWGHFEAEIMDWSIIEPYRNLIKNLVLAISWYLFLRKVQKRLPDIINGVSSGGDA